MNKNKKLSALEALINKRRSRSQAARPKTVQKQVVAPKVEEVAETPTAPIAEEVAETPTAPIAEEVAETPTAPIAEEVQVETPVEVPQEAVETEVKPKRRNRKNREAENG